MMNLHEIVDLKVDIGDRELDVVSPMNKDNGVYEVSEHKGETMMEKRNRDIILIICQESTQFHIS